MRLASYCLCFGVFCALSNAPLLGAIVYTGGALMEDFDSLPTSGISDYYENDEATPVVEWGFQRVVPGSDWEGTQYEGSQVDGSENGMHLNSITSGGTSSAGTVGSAGDGTDQAIYMIASGSFTPAMGVEIVNGTGEEITFFSIEFTQELWRTAGDSGGGDPGEQNTISAEWGTTDAGVGPSDFLTAGSGFTAETALDLVSNDPPSPFAVSFIDGNDSANQETRTATITFGTPIGVGESFFLRFTDTNDDGRDAALAIDDFKVTSNVVPEPTSLMLLGLLGFGAFTRQKR